MISFSPLMDLLGFLIIGILAGWTAGLLLKGRGFGLIGDMIIGIIGAVIGGFLFRSLGFTAYGVIGSYVMAVIGALVLLFFVGLIKRTEV
ncbi:MAG TPA: GlsB/YeaQ/YmgE family stress response membrane protein [Candidatus Peribacteraceae bacterium]|nr:GlsB/YeaQ/YmgE family stress response membrane protein [Candidatus Peribacteraceae bacterium]